MCHRKVPGSTPAEALIFNFNFFFTKLYKGGCPSESMESPRSLWRVHRESTESPRSLWRVYGESMESMESPQSLWRVHGVYGESTESPHGIHETVFHGVLTESTVFQTVPLDSMWSLWRLYMDSTWTPHRVHVDYWEPVGNGLWSPQRLLMESLWSPHGVHEESLRSPQRLRRVFVESMETRGGV